MHAPHLPPAHSSQRRSIAKTLTWRGLASSDGFLRDYLFTPSPSTAEPIAVGEVVTKMALYYFHERIWSHVNWGYRAAPEAEPANPAGPAR